MLEKMKAKDKMRRKRGCEKKEGLRLNRQMEEERG